MSLLSSLRISRRVAMALAMLILVVAFTGAALGQAGDASPVAQGPAPQEPTAPDVSTLFTYQGQLTDGGALVNNTCDFQFTLWPAGSGGTTPLATDAADSVPVTDGRFTAVLDFGASFPTGADRWLGVQVRCPAGAGNYTSLGRQRLTATPYAQTANTASNADTVDGYHASNIQNSHTHAGQDWPTVNTSYGLRVDNSGTYALFGGGGSYGVYGSGSSYALYGAGGTYGVYGNGSTYGVYGNSSSNYGVFGNSGYTGVWGQGTSYGVIGINANTGVYGSGSSYGVFSSGPAYVSGLLTKAGGGFKIDHPQDPENKYLVHSFVESPDMMNVYNGNVTLDANGEAWVEMPGYFEALNMDFRYQLTPIGGPGPNLYVAGEIQDNRFQIAGGEAGLKVSWQVTGIRNDPWAQENRPEVEPVKAGDELGTLLHPEVYGQPVERGFDYLFGPSDSLLGNESNESTDGS